MTMASAHLAEGGAAVAKATLPVPFVLLSAAMSLDGCIDGAGAQSLVLSGPEDCRAVHGLRAAADAVLIGAGTLRRDDPRLTVRFPDLAQARVTDGRSPQPLKVVVTRTGAVDAAPRFFATEGDRLILCPAPLADRLRDRLGTSAEVAGLEEMTARTILTALAQRGVQSLLVEGGSSLLTQFLAEGAFHRLRLAIAPFLIGDATAPRLVGPGVFPHGPGNRLRVVSSGLLGDMTVLELANDAVG